MKPSRQNITSKQRQNLIKNQLDVRNMNEANKNAYIWRSDVLKHLFFDGTWQDD